ncbi:23S rRNA (cytidine1920-2'-O)/16S rRNA (cytidine1409-2'-O)-methyltransferase [Alkalibacillus filiformis]|uniref:23S rRNA (Cytidine1920-2'-O)/16S rRNA (Cytidine1409-2'-O)-methyltransferase n=1 Tax=Alkalibacillus filiformis TaxID=200990 RepID=A0ABU0DRI1_9BACI|nr:TlyA family RNA methyltransferase [Alkalibacillus filiformis]MDQ0350975.1 23S rRNA (cytidine1920-2'-O)/16S rRNA (cytidine1409-2'-O)-methyltransferase [Alkalibacillus filiformis]
MKKVRLDTLLVEQGFFDSREKAKRSIMAGLVHTDHERLDKPGVKVDPTINIIVKGKAVPYVSRGGLKLEKAINSFKIDFSDRLIVDIGSSTGGFTDCALQHGAKASYAIDVGYNQLDWKLRQDERVYVMERTNFRYVTKDHLEFGLPNMAVTDVSFISLKLIFPVIRQILEPDSDIVALIKPQFEAGREQVGKKGIVRDKSVHTEVVHNILSFVENEGFVIEGLDYSPITGGDGNIEFLLHAKWLDDQAAGNKLSNEEIDQVINKAHEDFHK